MPYYLSLALLATYNIDPECFNDLINLLNWQISIKMFGIGQMIKQFDHLRYIAAELLFAAARPVIAMERSLYQRCHDAAHTRLISTAITLPVMFHS